ncbi:hypothetical protein AB1283_00820 [Bacillus sp. S13(2024)]|uniref:hypothetical protein n=1 Tax=Bacillus sp. S13(2024) TaxID=3162885 RepID=UPI003D1A1E07
MKGKEFVDLLQSGIKPVIEFNKETWSLEYDPDIGMRARAITVTYDGDGVWKVGCDLSEFEEYNRQFETKSYYDKNGNASLSWRETSLYPKNKIYDVYIDEDYDIVLTIIENNLVYNEYLKSNSADSYVVWSEKEILNKLQALREIDNHIRLTSEPISYIIETLKRVLPEYQDSE